MNNFESRILFTGLVYLKKMSEIKYPIYWKNIKILILVVVILGNKMINDFPFNNIFFADFSNIDLELLNQEEMKVLKTLDYNLFISDEEINEIIKLL